MKKIICALIILSLPSLSEEFKSTKSKLLVEQLVSSINQHLADITALEIAAGAKRENIIINLTQASQFDSGRFGAMMSADKLGTIILVTPNSPASLLGVLSGDILLKVNDRLITDHDFNWKEQLQFAQDNTNVSILVERKSTKILLKGTLKGKYIPNWKLNSSNDELNYSNLVDSSLANSDIPAKRENGNITEENKACGRIIAYEPLYMEKPGIKFSIPSTLIKSIDGEVVARGRSRFKLTVGEHVLEIRPPFEPIKKLTINVKANRVYSIGIIGDAQWINDKGDVVVPEDYYGPAILKISEQKCEL